MFAIGQSQEFSPHLGNIWFLGFPTLQQRAGYGTQVLDGGQKIIGFWGIYNGNSLRYPLCVSEQSYLNKDDHTGNKDKCQVESQELQ